MLSGSILQELNQAHQASSSKRPLNFGVYYKNTLVALCHALEDAILHNDYQPLMITAFQRGKWYLEEANRYGEIADRSQQVVILAAPDAGFAEHSTSCKPNVALVSLSETDPVSQEWHLIILSPRYTAMVLCQELTAADYGATGIPTVDLERKFYGFWTFEPNLVLEVARLAVKHISPYQPQLQQQLTAQIDAIAAQIEQSNVPAEPAVDHLGDTVARVIDYLQIRQHDLDQSPYAATDLLDSNLLSSELQALLRLAQLMDQTDLSNPLAAAEVSNLAEAMGQLLDLPAWQIQRLRLAGLLHRIAFLSSAPFLTAGVSVQQHAESPNQAPACPLVLGIQVLRRMPRLRAIATILLHQTEWWNGSGQPAGLAGDEIPIESRILALLAEFQRLAALQRSNLNSEEILTRALHTCQTQSGERWDPKLVEVLGLLVSALLQGWDLPVALPRIAAGLWLVGAQAQEPLPVVYAPGEE
jgi:DICT domain-containing protein